VYQEVKLVLGEVWESGVANWCGALESLGGCDVNAWVGDWSFSVSAFPGSDARDCSLVRIFTRASKIDLKIVWPRLDLNMLKRPMCLCFSFYALVSML
jgi:hypothetical protein